MSEILLIRAENEDLRDGKAVSALLSDLHKLHVLEHRSVLANPDSRRDPKLVAATLAHIQQHIDLYQQLQQSNPALLALLGEPPIPATPQPNQGNPAAPVNPGAVSNPAPAVQQQAQNVKPAGMPHLPAGAPPQTQQAFNQIKSTTGT